MNKIAIRNFAVWARNKLIADVSYHAGLMGITKNGISQALPQSTKDVEFFDIGTSEPYAVRCEAIQQRKSLVNAIRQKEKDSNYETAYSSLLEEVAYTWFNRLIAVRFMEVNDYLPAHVRVLSSESGKQEPDLVTNPFDAELSFTDGEEQIIIQMKNDNKLDEVFRILFIKQCRELSKILPRLFEGTNDYSELLLSLSYIEQDGVIYHLIHDISEDDFNVEKGGQVEIIGWLYQFYIAEPKEVLINAHKKYKKNEIPFVTQLFTSDWIVRYMVENSLGRLWYEGHKNELLKEQWQYYLETTKQDNNVEEELNSIRLSYASLNPKDIKILDPCMGSGHILVYAFDVLMQIYESVGYTQRDAAKSIVENNLYGLDIDERAAQLAYFAVLMKARKYNRRILAEGVKCNVLVVNETNGISREALKRLGNNKEKAEKLYDIFVDAKEYGSIIDVDLTNDELDSIYNSIISLRDKYEPEDIFMMMDISTLSTDFMRIVEQAYLFKNVYDVVVTNPPYMSSSLMPNNLKKYINNHYSDYKADLFSVFTKRCMSFCKKNGHIGLLMPYVWMFISSYEKMREEMNSVSNITSLVQLEYNAFEAACVPVAALTICMNPLKVGGEYVRLSDFRGCENQGPRTIDAIKDRDCGYRYTAYQNTFSRIKGAPVAYWVNPDFVKLFNGKLIEDYGETSKGIITGDNSIFLRLWFEVERTKLCTTANSYEDSEKSDYKWYLCNKGGEFRKWYGNNDYVIDWWHNGYEVMQKGREKVRNCQDYANKNKFKKSITWTSLSSSKSSFRFSQNALSESAGMTLFINEELLLYVLSFMNSKVCNYILNVLNPTLNYTAGSIGSLPLINVDESLKKRIMDIGEKCLKEEKKEWDSFENSWEFKKHPLI